MASCVTRSSARPRSACSLSRCTIHSRLAPASSDSARSLSTSTHRGSAPDATTASRTRSARGRAASSEKLSPMDQSACNADQKGRARGSPFKRCAQDETKSAARMLSICASSSYGTHSLKSDVPHRASNCSADHETHSGAVTTASRSASARRRPSARCSASSFARRASRPGSGRSFISAAKQSRGSMQSSICTYRTPSAVTVSPFLRSTKTSAGRESIEKRAASASRRASSSNGTAAQSPCSSKSLQKPSASRSSDAKTTRKRSSSSRSRDGSASQNAARSRANSQQHEHQLAPK
mmetsp:Transcript_22636/g.69967  ORF Transcript_22636/g.69967 Transcript_22636/m.69967 type:complete len:295 (+) Transcript_22636:322-1206(+)